MLSRVGKVRISLFLFNLSFKDSTIPIDPLVLGLCLVGVLFRDVCGALELHLDLEVLSDKLT